MVLWHPVKQFSTVSRHCTYWHIAAWRTHHVKRLHTNSHRFDLSEVQQRSIGSSEPVNASDDSPEISLLLCCCTTVEYGSAEIVLPALIR